jgi:hypothetical protein
VLALGAAVAAGAAETAAFRPATAEGAELKLVGDLAVLTLQGSPDKMGRQSAALTGDAMKRVAEFPRLLVMLMGRQGEWAKHAGNSRAMFEQFPADHRQELDACAAAAGMDREKLVILNTILDVYGGFGCSSLIAEGRRSATGAPLFGRNVDFPLSALSKLNLVTVYRPEKKHAFAAVGYPGLLGVVSGMNDQGLALAVHGVFSAGRGGTSFDVKGVPCTMLCRHVLEECATVEEAEKLLKQSKHTTALCVVLCDRTRGAVVEVSPGGTAARASEDGLCACTNHFRAGRRIAAEVCPRYATLRQAARQDKLRLEDIARKLHEVNQGAMTVQTMVFAPASLELHLAAGSCPASALPLKRLAMGPLLGVAETAAAAPAANGTPAADAKRD